MNRNPFALVVFLAFAIPMFGWVSQNPINLVELVPAALACWVIAGSAKRSKLGLKVTASLFFLLGIGLSLVFLNVFGVALSLLSHSLAFAIVVAALVIVAIVSDWVTGVLEK